MPRVFFLLYIFPFVSFEREKWSLEKVSSVSYFLANTMKGRRLKILLEFEDFVTANIRCDGTNMSNSFTSITGMTYIVGLLRAVILVTAY